MPMTNRKYFYNIKNVDGSTELDYIESPLHTMNLKTFRKERVTQAFAGRIDLISFKYYGSYDLGWLICEHNNILDPFTEITVGKVLDIPSLDDYYRYYNRNARGV